MSDDDKVTRLPIGFKQPPQEDGRVFKIVDRWSGECTHDIRLSKGRYIDVTYLLREGETEVECGNCGTKLDPMWVLRRLAVRETGYEDKRRIAHEEMARLAERSRTKCDNCGHMTRISRAKVRSA